MGRNSQLSKMQSFPEAELLKILKNWERYNSDSVEAALILAEKRGINIEEFKNQIKIPEAKKSNIWFGRIIKYSIQLLAIIQIVGGLFGFFVLNIRANPASLLLVFLMAFSAVSGIYLLKERKVGFFLSCINFLLQLLYIQIGGIYGYKFFTGIHFGLEFGGEIISLFAEIGTSGLIGTINSGSQSIIGVNIFSIIALAILIKRWKWKK